jgi:ankyrin repeat protein
MSCPLFFSAPASAVPNGTGLPHDHGHTLLRHCGGTVMTMRIPERMPPLPDVPGSSEAPHQLVVPGPGASVEEVRTFVRALPGGTLESYSRTGLTTASNLRRFVTHFRIRSIDPTDERACSDFAADLGLYDFFQARPSFLNKPDAHGMTPLMRAVQERDYTLFRDLINHGAECNVGLLSFAIRNNAADAFIKSVFEKVVGSDLSSMEISRLFKNLCLLSELGRRPLVVDCLELLLAHAESSIADMTSNQPRTTEKAHLLFDAVCLLSKRNLPLALECLDWNSRMTFFAAAICGHADVIPLLKESGKDGINRYACRDPNLGSETPLIHALRGPRGSRHAVVQALLEAGAKPNKPSQLGRSPLDVARELDLKSLAMVLIRYGAVPNATLDAWINSRDDES